MNSRRSNKLLGLLVFAIMGFFGSVNCWSGDLSVQLNISESLPAGITGISRYSAPVSAGIPLPESAGITSVTQLGLSGTTAGQFRPLAWWPNGNIKWVLVDFQKDLTAGTSSSDIVLKNGSGNFGGSNLASDGASFVTISTGTSQFKIRKSNFNIFDTAEINGQLLVNSGNSGRIEAIGTDGAIYSSSNDTYSTAVIEENGPVRAVVKATGALKSAAGIRLMDYTLRLHFYKGSSQVKGVVVLRNASKDHKKNIVFTSVELVVPLAASGQKAVTFSRKADEVTRSLPLGKTAYLYQGYNKSIKITTDADCFNLTPPIPGTCSTSYSFTPEPAHVGLAVQVGDETVNVLGSDQDWTQGYADLSNASGNGVTVAQRWMSAYWPAGFEFKDSGEASIELYSKHNGGQQIKLEFGRHDTHTVMWDFHTRANNGRETLYSLQYPVIARASFEHYSQSKAIFGQQAFVTPEQQDTYYSAFGRKPPTLSNPVMSTIYRSWQWSNPGGNNQINFPMDDLFDYLRTGNPGFYLLGEQRTIWNLDSAIGFSDDYVGYWRKDPAVIDLYPALKNVNGALMDTEHAHQVSIPFYYFLSGDENIKEGYLDTGETIQKNNDMGYYAIPGTPYFRAWSWQLRNLALAYEFSCQVGECNLTWKQTLENAISTLMDSREDGSATKFGRNMDRGFIYWESNARTIHSFYLGQIHFEAVWQLWRIMNDTNWRYSRLNDLEGYLTGLSQFLFYEYVDPVTSSSYFYGYATSNKYAFEYNFKLDSAPVVSATSPLYRTFDASRAALWGYQHTGDTSFLDIGYELVWECSEESTPRNASELQSQALMWTYFNKDKVLTWKNIPVNINYNDSGSYILSWTVPPGAIKFKIKYSDKQIVEWLGFDKVSRTYQYDPNKYTAFFAAKNITSNPAPAALGTTQSIVLTGLPAGQKFAMKYLSAEGTSSDKFSPNWVPNLRRQ